jgi:hypothetical protein
MAPEVIRQLPLSRLQQYREQAQRIAQKLSDT